MNNFIKTKPLFYIHRKKYEDEVKEWLRERIIPSYNRPEVCIIKGKEGTGKKTLIEYVIKNHKELKEYEKIIINFNTNKYRNLKKEKIEKNKNLLKIIGNIIGIIPTKISGSISSFISVITEFEGKKSIETTNWNSIFQLLEHSFSSSSKPNLWILNNIENLIKKADNELVEIFHDIGCIIKNSYDSKTNFHCIIITKTDDNGNNTFLELLNQKLSNTPFITTEHINEKEIKYFTLHDIDKNFNNVGLDNEISKEIFHFTNGNIYSINFLWEEFQKENIIEYKTKNSFKYNKDLLKYISTNLSKVILNKITKPPRVPKNCEFKEILAVSCLFAAAMGESFLPSALVNIFDVENLKQNEWEDALYDFLEFKNENIKELASVTKTNSIIKGYYHSFFVYEFNDNNFRILLKQSIKQMCSPLSTENYYYNKIELLIDWLKMNFKNNMIEVLDYIICLYRIINRYNEAYILLERKWNYELLKQIPIRIDKEDKKNEKYALIIWLVDVLTKMGKFQEALKQILCAKGLIDNGININKEEKSKFYYILGGIYNKNGKYKVAKDYCLYSLNLLLSTFDEENNQVSDVYNLLSIINLNLGRLEDALKLQLKSLKIREKVLDEDHPDLANSYGYLAMIYRDIGKLEEALRYELKALKIHEKVLDEDHPVLATSYNNLAMIYRDIGKLEKALRYELKALKIHEKVLDEDHPNLATSYSNLSTIYFDIENYKLSERYMQKAIDIMRRKFPNGHKELDGMIDKLVKITNMKKR